MSKILKELKATLKIEQESMDKADGMSDWDNYHQYKGWVEALEYAIGVIENPLYREDKKTSDIKLPIYGYDASEHDDIDGNDYVYDFEEMANELENRICKTLNRNVLITLSEVDKEDE